MKRRSFLAVISSVFAVPLAFLRGKPAKAATESAGCLAGEKGAQGLLGSPAGDAWFTAEAKRLREEHKRNMTDFWQEHWNEPWPPVLIELDYSPLRWDGPKDRQKHSRAPWIILEHATERDGEDGLGRLVVDQLLPCRMVKLGLNGRTDEGPCPPQMDRVLEFDLADPYQLLLADLLVRGLIDKGVVQSESFIRSWNQIIIDSQMLQFSDRARAKDDPDAPVFFVAEDIFQTRQATGADPSSGTTKPGRRLCHVEPPNDAIAQELAEHHKAVEWLEQRRREGPSPWSGPVV